MSQGVVAAGHPFTAEAGAEILRRGGNAVDAAICSVLTSFAVESPLTGLGAGGFMLIQIAGGRSCLLDFFVQTPGIGADHSQREELVPIDVLFDEVPQTFNIGAASCGAYGTPRGLWHAAEKFGTVPFRELAEPGITYAREGSRINEIQAYIFKILEPVLTRYPEPRAIYAPDGQILGQGDTVILADLADGIERLAQDGPEPFYSGEIAERVVEWVGEHGGVLTAEDLAGYQAVERNPVRVNYRDREVLTNPPPSSGGVLIAYSLALLERVVEEPSVELLVRAIVEANTVRTGEFIDGLQEEGFVERFLASNRLAEASEKIGRGGKLGSTTHISVIDGDGNAATVTCSNGCCSGVLVPGTGVHLNNMMGEQDLNPHGFHLHTPGTRIPSMMAPTVVLRDGQVEAALGSAGSNRIRSAILQTVMNLVDRGMSVEQAVRASRVHFEDGVLDLEPGIDPEAIAELGAAGAKIRQWQDINLYFGGVQACVRDLESGRTSGAGDPRRGGAVAVA